MTLTRTHPRLVTALIWGGNLAFFSLNLWLLYCTPITYWPLVLLALLLNQFGAFAWADRHYARHEQMARQRLLKEISQELLRRGWLPGEAVRPAAALLQALAGPGGGFSAAGMAAWQAEAQQWLARHQQLLRENDTP